MASARYVYTIVPKDTLLPADLTGFGERPLLLVEEGPLAAVISEVEQDALQPTAAHILKHEAVVEAVGASGMALPVRFGTILPDVWAVRESLARQSCALTNDLVRLGNKVELSILALWPEAQPIHMPMEGGVDSAGSLAPGELTAPGAGTRYLRARQALYRCEASSEAEGKALAAEMATLLHGYTHESRSTVHTTPRLAARVTFLIDKAHVAACRRLLGGLGESHPGVRILISGPWPPYSFVKVASDRMAPALEKPR